MKELDKEKWKVKPRAVARSLSLGSLNSSNQLELRDQLESKDKVHARTLTVLNNHQNALKAQIKNLEAQIKILSKVAIRENDIKPQCVSEFKNYSNLLESLSTHLLDAKDVCLEEPVGEGAFGQVWRGTYKNQIVAVKFFYAEEEKVLEEASMLDRVKNLEHVIQFVGIVWLSSDPLPQLAVVTRFMSNRSAFEILINESSPLYQRSPPILFLMKMAVQAAKGVRNLHRNNVIHRDLACRNLLLDDQMTVYVSDFGFARLRASHKKEFSNTNLGPVKWEAPESLRNKEFSEKTDVFSFGVTLYEIFVQCPPWKGLLATNVAFRVQNGERMKLPINIDPIIGNLILKCWLDSPEERPDMEDVYDVLVDRFRQTQSIENDAQWEINTMEKLLKGMVLVKVPFRHGKPSERFFFISPDMRKLIWRHIDDTTGSMKRQRHKRFVKEKSEFIHLFQEIKVGRHTKNFRKFPNFAQHQPAFSIITQNRTFDLICPNREQQDHWLGGLKFCMNRLRPTTQPLKISDDHTSPANHSFNQLQTSIIDKQLYLTWNALSELRRGYFLLKCGGNLKGHERFFKLSNDMHALEWTSHAFPGYPNKEKKLAMARVVSIKKLLLTRATSRFLSKGNTLYDKKLGFALIGYRGKELLTLVAPNQAQFMLWTAGLEKVIAELKKTIPAHDVASDHGQEDEGSEEEELYFDGCNILNSRGIRKICSPIRSRRSAMQDYQTGEEIGISIGLKVNLNGSRQSSTFSKEERLLENFWLLAHSSNNVSSRSLYQHQYSSGIALGLNASACSPKTDVYVSGSELGVGATRFSDRQGPEVV